MEQKPVQNAMSGIDNLSCRGWSLFVTENLSKPKYVDRLVRYPQSKAHAINPTPF